jgi:hypothetical protein
MIEIEMLLTFVYFLECTVVQCKDALSICWNRANGLNFMHPKWHTGSQYMVKSAESRMRSNLELLPVINANNWLKFSFKFLTLNNN